MRVLLVDIDPQGNAGLHLLGPEVGSYNETVYQVLRGELPAAEALRPVPTVPGLDVLPANITLAAAEAELLVAVGRETLLAEALENVAGYDYVLIDSPPSLGILTLNALAAADQVLVPVQVHFFALTGLSILWSLVDRIHTRVNKRLRIAGLIATFYNARDPRALKSLSSCARLLVSWSMKRSSVGTPTPRRLPAGLRPLSRLVLIPSVAKTTGH